MRLHPVTINIPNMNEGLLNHLTNDKISNVRVNIDYDLREDKRVKENHNKLQVSFYKSLQ